MCRNIRTLYNFEPPVAQEEIRAASLQFVRKLSGFNKPSKANEAAFLLAVADVTRAAQKLLVSLETSTPPKEPRRRSGQSSRAKRPSIPACAVAVTSP